MSIRILIVDDEEPIRRLLHKELSRKGFHTDTAENGNAALQKLMQSSFEIILLDIMMPGMDGISLLKKLKNDPASPAIIVLTGKATVDTAVGAMKNGAYDYLTKPYKLEELSIVIGRAYEQRKLSLENQLLQKELARRESPDDFVGNSLKFRQVLKLIDKIAPTDSTVLITGESGTGKELVAHYLWKKSRRNDRVFIAVNCSTLSENLVESELFGHEKGAFTNAVNVKNGLVETADGGTLFLDEISEVPVALQTKLLRFLDSGEFRRVGANKNLKAHVRIIAATNRDLNEAIAKGSFREDLFYRLNVINIDLPPLRERKEDIKPLAEYFIKKYGRKISKAINAINRDAEEALIAYDWPGNVRELENVIERAVILCENDVITRESLAVNGAVPQQGSRHTFPQLQEIEKDHILMALKKTGGNQTKASKMLGLDRKTLYLKLKRYGISS
ncbi:MAG: sigma-54-dependent Fis family transcriptional regulator [Nitrospiraceae bacterium]|nr:MAG: sigma-54-dependent Fis family transcriptional regulator [Nitrospiraceae bacterium]